MPPELPAADDAIPAAAAADIAIVHGLQADAGIAALLGPDGEAALAAIDQSQQTFADEQLPGLTEQLDLPSARTAPLAGVGLFAWTPSFSGRNAFSASLLTGFLATAVGSADQDRPRSSVSHTETYDTTAGGIREQSSVKTTLTLQTGGGRLTGEVELVTTTNATDAASGAAIGTLIGTARGTIEVNACPDEDGVAAGQISFAWQEEISRSGAPGAGGAATVEAPVRFINGDDAHLVETQLDLGFSKGAHGPGSPGSDPAAPFDWGVTGSMSVVIPAGSGSVSVDDLSTESNGATADQQTGAATAAITQATLMVTAIGGEAERFWRSGRCVELKPSEQSREVQPGEEISFSVDAIHRFDGAQVEGGIVATFSGSESVQPVDTPVDAPADFDFVAGRQPGDKGTISLEQTSKRGIGMATVEFTVGSALSIAIDGDWRPLPDNELQITVPETELVAQDDGSFQAEVDAPVTGTVGFPGCTVPFSETIPLRITARLDETDPTLARVRLELASGDGLFRVQITCGGATTLAPVPVFVWVLSFLGPTGQGVEVRVDEPTTVTGTGGAAGATTIISLSTGANTD